MKRFDSEKRVILSASALSGLQSILRIYFAYLGFTGGINEFLTTPISQGTLQFINYIFSILGIAGMVATLGLLMEREWGLWCAILVSVFTVFFDVWGLTIQYTAAIGFVIPILIMILLYKGRHAYGTNQG